MIQTISSKIWLCNYEKKKKKYYIALNIFSLLV